MEYLTDEDYAIAAKNGIKKLAVYKRLYYLGWSVKQAIHTPTMKRTDKRGSKYEKYYAIGEKNGIPNKRVYYRINYARWSLKDACTVPIRKYESRRAWHAPK
jgi:hypothetical protein